MTTVDTIRAVATYVIAAIVVIGGFVILRDPSVDAADHVVIAGFVGSALTFVFSSEVQTRTARQAAASTAAANASNGNGNGTH